MDQLPWYDVLMSMHMKSSLLQILQLMFCFGNFYYLLQEFINGLVTGQNTTVIFLRHLLIELDVLLGYTVVTFYFAGVKKINF